MNFEIKDEATFTIDGTIYKRIFQVLKKTNGMIKVSNVLDGSVLFTNLELAEVFINGNAIINVKQMQNVVYNTSCACFGNDETFGNTFDNTFDETFN